MSKFFQDIAKDANKMQQKYLGPDYPYAKAIATPKELKMSSKGTLSALGNNIGGIVSYTQLLIEGTGKATKTGKPLGNRFFLKTGGKCIDKNKKEHNRYMYVDNIPNGNIPLLSGASGANFGDLKGLIPGIVTDMGVLNPLTIMSGFMMGNKPRCRQISMKTVDLEKILNREGEKERKFINNPDWTDFKEKTEAQYVADGDITNIPACSFPGKRNPVNNNRCREAFVNANQQIRGEGLKYSELRPDAIGKLFNISASLLMVYLIYSFMEKTR